MAFHRITARVGVESGEWGGGGLGVGKWIHLLFASVLIVATHCIINFHTAAISHPFVYFYLFILLSSLLGSSIMSTVFFGLFLIKNFNLNLNDHNHDHDHNHNHHIHLLFTPAGVQFTVLPGGDQRTNLNYSILPAFVWGTNVNYSIFPLFHFCPLLDWSGCTLFILLQR